MSLCKYERKIGTALSKHLLHLLFSILENDLVILLKSDRPVISARD